MNVDIIVEILMQFQAHKTPLRKLKQTHVRNLVLRRKPLFDFHGVCLGETIKMLKSPYPSHGH